MRKTIAVFLCLGVTIGMLAGCGRQGREHREYRACSKYRAGRSRYEYGTDRQFGFTKDHGDRRYDIQLRKLGRDCEST